MAVYGTPRRTSAISLARYAEIINYTDCAFFGVAHPDNDNYACREIWTKYQRDDLQRHLAEAEDEIEEVVGYPLSPKWITDEVHPFALKIITKKTNIIELGVEVTDDIALATAVVVADPSTVTIPTALTSLDGIKVYYPGTDVEISPSDMEITGGNLIITIPDCRLVEYSLRDNPVEGLPYADPAIYQATVDVKQHYTDASTQISVVWPHGCNPTCSSGGCTRYTETACGVILDPEIGEVSYKFAAYSGGSWTFTNNVCCKGNPQKVEINYRAGTQELTSIAELAIIRLAHSKMIGEPCGCDVIKNMWRRDNTIPVVLSVERLECPFGLSNGAWMAWKFAGAISVDRMTVFG